MKPRDEIQPQRVSCWFCEHRFPARQVLRDGILRSRTERAGGPYRLFICPSCGKENVCEKSPKGRWFASPNYRFSFLDYLFSQVLDRDGAQTILAALTWFRENEDRRRYFFERDGDRRYSGHSILRRLWPLPPPSGPQPEAARSRRSHRVKPEPEETADSTQRSRRGSTKKSGEPGEDAPSEDRPRVRGLVTPHEVLGVEPTATEREIREAFHRLAIHYHPDKVHHLGEAFEQVAKEKFQELKDAYEILVALRARER